MNKNQSNSVNIVPQNVLKVYVKLLAADKELFNQLNIFWGLEAIDWY